MADVHLYPYGNAREKQSAEGWEFTCQHGPTECFGNVIEACALKYITDPLAQQKFFVCVETHVRGQKHPDFKNAAMACTTDAASIMNCANGKEGMDLQHTIAVETEQLNPRHTHVPWIVVDGVHEQQTE
jgi:interferon gamma-inducible protein 30